MIADTTAISAGQPIFPERAANIVADLSYANVARRANRFSRNMTTKHTTPSETTRSGSDGSDGEVGSLDGESEASTPCGTATQRDTPATLLPRGNVVQPRAQLNSKASLFVPRQAQVAIMVPVVPAVVFHPPVDPVPAVIRQVFGSNLKGIKETKTEHSTSLQVELDNAPSPPGQEQSIHSHAVECLKIALNGTLSRNLKDMRSSADGCELTFEFFSQGTNRLCWKFASGCCRRGDDCYWEHAVAQFFLISFVLSAQQPSSDDVRLDHDPAAQSDVAFSTMEWQPEMQDLLPPDVRSKQESSTRSSSPDSTVASSIVSPTRSGLISPAAGRTASADLEDDDDKSQASSSIVSPVRSGLFSPAGRVAWADLEDDDEY